MATANSNIQWQERARRKRARLVGCGLRQLPSSPPLPEHPIFKPLPNPVFDGAEGVMNMLAMMRKLASELPLMMFQRKQRTRHEIKMATGNKG